MGIPRLTAFTAPYAVSKVIGCDNPDGGKHSLGKNRKVIIDGPALAYTIHDRLMKYRSRKYHGLAAVPTYEDLGNATLAFLSKMEEHGVQM